MLISAHANGALIKVLYVDIHFTVLVFFKQTTVLVPTNMNLKYLPTLGIESPVDSTTSSQNDIISA